MSERKPIILTIDDTPDNLMLLGNALEVEFDLRVATSGMIGLELAAAQRPDLILLDIMMPDMDGFEVCRRLKADPLLAGIPVIFVTAVMEIEAEATGLTLGAADYLTKPLNVAVARQRIRNLIEREQLRRAVEHAALAAAERLATLKQQFLRNVSHELRTPLNGIIGLAGLGQRAADLDKARLHCGRIHAAAQQLLGMIENVLDFANAQAGTLRVDRQPFDLAPLLAGLAGAWGERAREKGLAFETTGLPMLAHPCRGDAGRIGQVLDQLLANAVKFTDQGGVAFSVERQGEQVLFRIIDTGIGMSEDDLVAAFRPFEQVDGSMTRRFGGIGLALSLVRHLVELMDGRLQIHSAPGRGTRVEVSLPLPLTD